MYWASKADILFDLCFLQQFTIPNMIAVIAWLVLLANLFLSDVKMDDI